MKVQTIFRKLCLSVLAAGLLAAVPGCESVFDDYPDPSGTLGMSVTLFISSATTTRADARHEDDGKESGSLAENHLDFPGQDFRIVLFDNAGNYVHEVDSDWKSFTSDATGSGTRYEVEYEIKFPKSVSGATVDDIKKNGLQIMVLANWQSAKGSGAYNNLFETGGGYQSLTQVWADKTSYNFPYTASNSETWRPDLGSKQLIPMFGYAQAPKFERRTSGGPLYSDVSVPMQRAVAKVEVIDNLESQPTLSVDGVTMTRYNTAGRLIPDVTANPGWNLVDSQVDVSSLPANVGPRTGLKFFHYSQTGKWIAYVPEMALDKLGVDARKAFNPESVEAKNRPHLEVSITNSDASSPYKGGTYSAHFARYNDNFEPTIPDESWNHILRNHIYRFSVNKVGLSVNLHLHVIPWDREDDEVWDFTDHVTISQALTWEEDTYDFLIIDGKKYGDATGDGEEGGGGDNQGGDTGDSGYGGNPDEDNEVYLKLDRTVLVGRFRIATPRNGWWYARLTPMNGADPNAVSFVDQDGGPLPGDGMNISGPIDGKEQMLYIRQATSNNENESRFKLEFWVENLGVWMSVPMPDGPYTIVRQGNLIQ